MFEMPPRTIALVGAVLVLSIRPAIAQQPTTEAAQMQQMMVPMMSQMAVVMLESTLTTLAKPENAERLADFTKNYYDALVKRGFTKEQALQLVAAMGIPRPMSPGRCLVAAAALRDQTLNSVRLPPRYQRGHDPRVVGCSRVR